MSMPAFTHRSRTHQSLGFSTPNGPKSGDFGYHGFSFDHHLAANQLKELGIALESAKLLG